MQPLPHLSLYDPSQSADEKAAPPPKKVAQAAAKAKAVAAPQIKKEPPTLKSLIAEYHDLARDATQLYQRTRGREDSNRVALIWESLAKLYLQISPETTESITAACDSYRQAALYYREDNHFYKEADRCLQMLVKRVLG